MSETGDGSSWVISGNLARVGREVVGKVVRSKCFPMPRLLVSRYDV